MKRCSECKIEKEFKDFYRCSSSKTGVRSNCIECCKEYKRNNKEKIKEYLEKNKEKIKSYYRAYDPIKEKEYYEKNKEAILLKRREDYQKIRSSKLEYQKEYQKSNKEKRNLYLSERRKNDPLFRLITNTRNLIYNSFYYNGYSKKSKTEQLLGCSFEEFRLYLESKFENWMNWNNRGLYNGELNHGWDIDHITPLSSAKTEEDIIKLNHYTNLQPLCSKINRDIKKSLVNGIV